MSDGEPMSAQPHAYTATDPETVLKYAIQHIQSDRVQIGEVTSESNADTDRRVKRARYAEYRAPLYLLVDRQERSCTLHAVPGRLGYTRVGGPLPFGAPVTLPDPFDMELDTSEF